MKSYSEDNANQYSYFPGCSLAATGHENNLSIHRFCDRIGIDLMELPDWNCCGSSSAHSVNARAARLLPQRNLSLVPKGLSLLVACPSCYLRLRQSHVQILNDPFMQDEYESLWNRAFDPDLEIIHFFDLFSRIRLADFIPKGSLGLNKLKFAPYYGCMLARPPLLRREKTHRGLLEKTLQSIGATPVFWPHYSKCCGTYLSVAKPAAATAVVNQIMTSAIDSGAECLVTACAMCHLNLEIRCTLDKQIPTLHFSELLSLALGVDDHEKWFKKHLVDPTGLLESRKVI